ncbi:aldose 1-epimerase [Occultella glacieicola]|uniref:Aldose 1-epimerase n=1 Tax=Occultella glacieicola TaxID=2518684 RepID=A0ABY2E6G5_9MICO|nr:aldose 1-epimerase [Occultella glacieicola]TDE96064.1 aldose 1-epimerase [Occultella glacieicola]
MGERPTGADGADSADSGGDVVAGGAASETGVARVVLDQGWHGVVLRTAAAELTVLPEKGCDLVSFVDARTGVDVLFRAPWGIPPRATGAWNAVDEPQWLERYPGGWQVLCPNGGAASPAPGGGTWGFHGEASRIPWQVTGTGTDGDTAWLRAQTRLTAAPLRLDRTIRLTGAAVAITETLENTGPDAIGVMWSHHPAFGAPLLGAGARISTGAGTFVADELTPGTHLGSGARGAWPRVVAADSSTRDLSVVPGPGERVATFGYLTDLGPDGAWYEISNPRLGLGVRLSWDAAVWPHAWFWQEMHASPGHPWWRQAYVCAIEPASTIPGHGVAGAAGADLLHLTGGERRTATIAASLVEAG